MFETLRQQTRILNFNPRSEKHGEENVLAGDLKLETTMHSSALDAFDANLRPLLYRKPGPGEQMEFPLGSESDGLTALRVPHLAPLKWEDSYPGYRLELSAGLELSEPLVLTEVELSNFNFEALEGGSVRITFRASFHPDGEQSGALCELIQSEAELTLTAPKAEEQHQQQLDAAA